ncbi:hypothetical protein ONZ45_g9846 [Pleurotus djamor]|nr:hypothetical protein ONZ45_g9846 [Pleurotus djamor]
MWSSPSVFAKTPKRHIREAIAASNNDAYLEQSLPPNPPPRSHARVSFYDGLWRIQDGQPANLFADIPLEPCGGLDLKKVCKKWGLESCVPVDPMRWEIFQPGKDPHMLSSLAVAVLSEEDGCIKFIGKCPASSFP